MTAGDGDQHERRLHLWWPCFAKAAGEVDEQPDSMTRDGEPESMVGVTRAVASRKQRQRLVEVCRRETGDGAPPTADE
jgi:hypothetical protein